jgi:hypothetical protein
MTTLPKKNSVFSVRSAYKLAVESKSLESCGTSLSADRKTFNAMWKTPVPQKIKIFVWKLARDALGVQTNRLKHHLIFDATCSICGVEPKNGHHAMVRCTKATAL